jgi:hypothetical protein
MRVAAATTLTSRCVAVDCCQQFWQLCLAHVVKHGRQQLRPAHCVIVKHACWLCGLLRAARCATLFCCVQHSSAALNSTSWASAPDSVHLLPVQVSYGAGAYICGEETALLESLEGKQVCRGA